MSTKDKEMMAGLVDHLETDEFYNAVAREVAEIDGGPLTEELRREIVANLRRGSVTASDADTGSAN